MQNLTFFDPQPQLMVHSCDTKMSEVLFDFFTIQLWKVIPTLEWREELGQNFWVLLYLTQKREWVQIIFSFKGFVFYRRGFRIKLVLNGWCNGRLFGYNSQRNHVGQVSRMDKNNSGIHNISIKRLTQNYYCYYMWCIYIIDVKTMETEEK